MNILICDDIPEDSEKLSGLLMELGHTASTCASGAGALEHIRSGAAVDVCVLDIVMPGMDGIELANRLRETGFGGEIVFLSASNEYGPQTYGVKAFYYLLKPPAPENVRRVLGEIEAKREKADAEGIKLKVPGGVKFFLFRDVEYAEVIKHYVTLSFTGGEALEVRATFAEIAPLLLCDGRFIQCHQSYIVNMDAIMSMKGREITMRCGARIPVSKSYPGTKMSYLSRGLGGGRK